MVFQILAEIEMMQNKKKSYLATISFSQGIPYLVRHPQI